MLATSAALDYAEFMDKQVSAEVLTRTDGVMLVLFSIPWRLEGFQRDNPDVKLGSLVAAEGRPVAAQEAGTPNSA